MRIIFSVVSRGIVKLAQHATCSGNFDDVVEHILANISLQNDAFSYSQGAYFFHYIRENEITYICITDDTFPRFKAFFFLLEIKRKFQSTYGNETLSALPYVINTEFSTILADKMQEYNTSRSIDTSARAQIELDELKEMMTKNIGATRMVGECIRLLVNNANENRARPTAVVITPEEARMIRNRNIIFWSFLIAAHVLLVYALGVFICGGPSWNNCGKK